MLKYLSDFLGTKDNFSHNVPIKAGFVGEVRK